MATVQCHKIESQLIAPSSLCLFGLVQDHQEDVRSPAVFRLREEKVQSGSTVKTRCRAGRHTFDLIPGRRRCDARSCTVTRGVSQRVDTRSLAYTSLVCGSRGYRRASPHSGIMRCRVRACSMLLSRKKASLGVPVRPDY